VSECFAHRDHQLVNAAFVREYKRRNIHLHSTAIVARSAKENHASKASAKAIA
jgi:hypothetical protein